MIKYKATTCYPFIEPVEVERETAASVWINGRRHSKRYGIFNFFDTFQDAKCWLIELAQQRVDAANYSLKRAKDFVDNVKGLKE